MTHSISNQPTQDIASTSTTNPQAVAANSLGSISLKSSPNSAISSENDHLFASSYNVNQQITNEQAFNEAIVQLCVLLYQIDGIVTLTEQDFFDSVCDDLDWRSGVSLPAFINNAIHEARVAIDTEQTREYLFSLGVGLNLDPATALDIAMDITAVDGARSDEELELLSLLSNRVLARGLQD